MAVFQAAAGRLLIALLIASWIPAGLADLRAAVRQRPAPASLPSDAPLISKLTVPLERVSPKGHKGVSFYVGTVSVGSPPQKMRVLFDTASAQVVLPHRACNSRACLSHTRYSPWESGTAMDVNEDGAEAQAGHRLAEGTITRDGATIGYTQADLGEGNLTAVFVRDGLCLNKQACVDMDLMAAIRMDDVPFVAMPHDGIVGLALPALASGPRGSFLSRLTEGARNVPLQFGIFLGATEGELTFGGHGSAVLAEPLRWHPVDHPDRGYWQVAIRGVYVGDTLVDACDRGCHGVVDTGASHTGVQLDRLPPILRAVEQRLATSATSGTEPCVGDDLRFDLGDGFSLRLRPSDYADDECHPTLAPLPLDEPEFFGVYTLGEALLRRYYAAFDIAEQKIGFAALVDAERAAVQEDGSMAAPIMVF